MDSFGRGTRKRRFNLTAALVCRPLWVPPPPDRWMDGRMMYERMEGWMDGRGPVQVFVSWVTVEER